MVRKYKSLKVTLTNKAREEKDKEIYVLILLVFSVSMCIHAGILMYGMFHTHTRIEKESRSISLYTYKACPTTGEVT